MFMALHSRHAKALVLVSAFLTLLGAGLGMAVRG